MAGKKMRGLGGAAGLSFVVLVMMMGARSPKFVALANEKAIDRAGAQVAFEQIKKLEGTWVGESDRGWKERSIYHTIARGSAVVEQSADSKPDESMLSVFAMDGDRLILTHYCIAKNQPRLLATSIDGDGRTVTFTFLDGTNLPSRDAGHMDRAVIQFVDDTHFSSQWTWYENGADKWTEKILYQKVSESGTRK